MVEIADETKRKALQTTGREPQSSKYKFAPRSPNSNYAGSSGLKGDHTCTDSHPQLTLNVDERLAELGFETVWDGGDHFVLRPLRCPSKEWPTAGGRSITKKDVALDANSQRGVIAQ